MAVEKAEERVVVPLPLVVYRWQALQFICIINKFNGLIFHFMQAQQDDGLFGIFWAAIAGWITYFNYRSGFTDKSIDSRVIEIEDDGENMTVTSRTGYETYSYSAENAALDSDNVEARMKKLQSLYDQALITRDEYEQKRKEILEDL